MTPRSPWNIFDRLTLQIIRDPRDLPFIRLILAVLFTVGPFAVYLFRSGSFPWWQGLAYLALTMGYFFPPFTLMLHNTSHRALFQPRFSWLRHLIPWGLSPFFGQTPETYFAHHIGMHHVEGNLPPDLSSTLQYRRDRFTDFLRYALSFLFTGWLRLLEYFRKKARRKLFFKVLTGELAFYGATATLLVFNWRATFVVLIVPLIAARLIMMAGNWAQHAFVDLDAPENSYRNSITCIHTAYNHRCFNDGYHIGHHLKPSRHWTEMPEDFLKNQEKYHIERAIVFQGIDFFGVWFLLMLKRYDLLAKRFVQAGEQTMTQDEIIALLKSRTAALADSKSMLEAGTATQSF